MRLPSFRYRAPRTITDAAAWLAAESPADTMLVAGGTDVIPNMKRRQQTPATIVGLRGIDGLATMAADGGGFRIGAGVTLSALAADSRLRAAAPGLWQAAIRGDAAPAEHGHHRRQPVPRHAVHVLYDQSYEWRRAIDFCMKKDGDTCWVATSSPRCLAVSSTDTAPVLQALGARIRLVSAAGEREMPVSALHANDGIHYLTRKPDEILTGRPPRSHGVAQHLLEAAPARLLRLPGGGHRRSRPCGPGRCRARRACGCRRRRLVPAGITGGRGAPGRRRALRRADRGGGPGGYAVAKPMDNTDFELVWRKKMVTALAGYALRELRGDDMSATRRRLARQVL
ncbi:MAG: FAD binding domain-containing protein [Vicinamibacterales bacterium]